MKKNKNKFISIIVPVYNVCDYLNDCLNSLVNQKYDNYEIIVVNDGSTDSSQNIIDKYAINYKNNFYSFIKSNGGASSARNFGISKAKGDYILFVDGDDFLELNALETLNNCLLKDEADIIVFNYYNVQNNDKKFVKAFNDKISDEKKRYILSNVSPWNKLFKRTILNNNLFPLNVLYYEDLAVIPSLALNSNKVVFLNEPLYNYVTRDNSATNQTLYNPKMDDVFVCLNNLSEIFSNHYKDELEYIHIFHLLRSAGLRYIDCNKIEKIDEIIKIMNQRFPKWRKNSYYKKMDIKKKIICLLIYHKKFKLLKLVRKK